MTSVIARVNENKRAKAFTITVKQSMGYLSNAQIRVLASALSYKSEDQIFQALMADMPAEDARAGMLIQNTFAQLKLDSCSPVSAAIVIAGVERVYAGEAVRVDVVKELLDLEDDSEFEEVSDQQLFNTLLGGQLGYILAEGLRRIAPKLLARTTWGRLLTLFYSGAGAAAGYLSSDEPARDPRLVVPEMKP